MGKQKHWKRWLQAGLVLFGTGILLCLAKKYEFPDIRVSCEEIRIPGLEKEYEFLFLTDLHLAVKTRQELGALGDADVRLAGLVNPRGTISAKQLPQWVSFANRRKVDAVLLGGDMIDYYSAENVDCLQSELNRLQRPYVFTLGNHELFSPWEEQIPEDAPIYELFQEKNTAFQILDYEDFVICAIDNEAYQVNEASLEQMKVWLTENSDKPMILLAHVPFFTEQLTGLKETSAGVWGQPLLIGEGARDTTAVTREFMELVFGAESPAAAVLTGDNHFYYKGKINDSVTQWVAAPAYAGNGMMIKVRGK